MNITKDDVLQIKSLFPTMTDNVIKKALTYVLSGSIKADLAEFDSLTTDDEKRLWANRLLRAKYRKLAFDLVLIYGEADK